MLGKALADALYVLVMSVPTLIFVLHCVAYTGWSTFSLLYASLFCSHTTYYGDLKIVLNRRQQNCVGFRALAEEERWRK